MVSWQFLLIGTFAALGAALCLGTLAALGRYHRTGRFPGETDPSREITRSQLIGLWLRVVVGAGLAVYGVISMQRAGLL